MIRVCGICGIYYLDGRPVELPELQAMTGRMVHRGPDDEGYYLADSAGLGMRRLSIIDLKGGKQPVHNESADIWVVLNGEIYNYKELRRELESKGHHFKSLSDTETLVHLYEEEGINGVHRLNGMFAFALYDIKKRALWVVRDRLGIKPLYYRKTDKSLTFCSDLHALYGALPAPPADFASFLRYFAFGYVPTPHTIYQDAKKLPPGSWLWIDPAGVKFGQYWALDKFETWRGTQEEAASQLLGSLKDAINLQLRSDVPVGVFLSGGTDSSALTALSYKKSPSPLHTFTIDFVGKDSADTKFASQVATKFKTDHRKVELYSRDADFWLNRLLPFMDEPIADSAIIPSYVISEKARQEGIKVLLTGAGGDEIFGGYQRHHRPKIWSARWLAESIPFLLRSPASKLLSKIDKDRGLRLRDPRVAFGTGISGVNLAILSRLFRKSAHLEQMLGALCEIFSNFPNGGNGKSYSYPRMQLDLRHYLVDNILSLTDKCTMASSVEGRVPLLDHRLVEFAFSLPEGLNLLGNQPKGLTRKVFQELLPRAILDRKKEGFNAPIQYWVTDSSLGQAIVKELLGEPIAPFQELFKINILRKIIADKHMFRMAGGTFFSLYILSRWYRTHIEEPWLWKHQV